MGTSSGFTAEDGTQFSGERVNYLSDDGGAYFAEDEYPNAVALTDDDTLYQSQRLGLFSYSLPVSNGHYTVTTKTAEFVHSATGLRSMNITVEGHSIAQNMDMVALVGQYAAYDVTAYDIAVTDGMLTLKYGADKDVAIVSAIVVTSADGAAVAPPAKTLTIQEGETGYCLTRSVPVDSNHEGFVGAGFANADNAIGAGLQWKIQANIAGSAKVDVRFANGSSTARSGTLQVNASRYAMPLPPTGGWTAWQTASVTVNLQAGVNTLDLLATTADGLANIDSLTVTGSGVSGVSCAEPAPVQSNGTTLAFPGAQGFGRFAVGGRGGEVVHVTNLNDSGAGSLRDAISKPNRIVVFDVGGVIKISSRLIFLKNQTIAGQTAPGDGITIYGNGAAFTNASNTIVRYIRFRMGKVGTSGSDAVSIARGNDIIFDHCSMSWSRDGTFDVNPDSGYTISNITVQDSIIGQGLQTHSTGGLLVADGGASIIRTLYIDNQTRNPKARGVLQFVNNVVYNWVVAGYILGDSAADSGTRYDGAMIGNYFISGPETSGSVMKSPSAVYHLYAKDNWYDPDKNGVLNGSVLGQGAYGAVTWHNTPSTNYPEVPTLTGPQALNYVIANAGTSHKRDAVDHYMIDELKSWGKKGATISDEKSLGLPNVVGNIAGGTKPTDTDNDGMPDSWEMANGLNPNSPSDAMQDKDGNGWVNIEGYINSLVL
ncbi:MAG: malectin domain-containing carbohydrate-binding protein [Marinagarivorans sp.]|nr:malectin domain-containing carbohydrate-binding protein [Marinagarivorans sp.]